MLLLRRVQIRSRLMVVLPYSSNNVEGCLETRASSSKEGAALKQQQQGIALSLVSVQVGTTAAAAAPSSAVASGASIPVFLCILILSSINWVVATAITYMRRVYISKSLTEYDPRLVAPTCLYLAAKAEESTVQARLLVFYIKKMYPDDIRYRYEIKDILEMEMKILEALNYYLVIFHPYRSLTQFLQDAGMMDLMQFTWGIVNDTYKMDLILMHPPHLIALACIYIASVSKDKDSVAWFEELRVDMNVVKNISMEILDLYDSMRNNIEERINIAFSKLPQRA